MQRESKPKLLREIFTFGRIQGVDVAARRARCRQHATAHLMNIEIISGNREDGQQSVAHELQDLPAMLEDGGDLTIEIVVEHSDDRLRRQPVRQVGVAAHIGEPDRGADFVGVATPDLARENTRAGVVAHIGVENIARGRYPLRPSSKNSKRHLRGERRVGLR